MIKKILISNLRKDLHALVVWEKKEAKTIKGW